MNLTTLPCLVCIFLVGHSSQEADTESTADSPDVLHYLQDLKDHVTKLEQRLNSQNARILKQEQIIQEQKTQLEQQRNEFVRRFAKQDETIGTLKRDCVWMEQWYRLHGHQNPSYPQKPSSAADVEDVIQLHHDTPQNDTHKRSDDLGPVVSHMTEQITEMAADIQTLKNTNTRQDQERGTAYIRWGHTGCPVSSELVYSGVVGGTRHRDVGGAANHLCLTSQPIFDGHTQPSRNGYASIYGSEYDICPEAECQTTPACAVCRVSRAASAMIPGTNTCSPGWTKEYSGYIMANINDYTGSSEFICVDSNHKHDSYSSQSDNNENIIYYTHTKCGALPCPPYENDKILTCVVCTK